MNLSKPIVCLSLDVEMLWGFAHVESKNVNLLKQKGQNMRQVIDFLLHSFEKYEVPTTWAIVGHLFLDRCEKKDGIPHKGLPRFTEDWYSCDPCSDVARDPLYYGRDIVEKLMSNVIKHEIAYHSFSHVPFSECTERVAEAEITEGIKLANDFGITFRSFVFPRNKIGHVAVLKRHGFKMYRSGGLNYTRQQKSLRNKIKAAMSNVIPLSTQPEWKEGIWELPFSISFQDWLVPHSALVRSKIGVARARQGTVFHIVIHPWMLLHGSLREDFGALLKFLSIKRDKGDIYIATMEGVASIFENANSH